LSVKDNEGKVKRVVGITIDVTERKQAEKERETLVHDWASESKNCGCCIRRAPVAAGLSSILDLFNEWCFVSGCMHILSAARHDHVPGHYCEDAGWRDSERKQSVLIKTSDGLAD